MKTPASLLPKGRRLLRSLIARGNQMLSCDVFVRGRDRYEVCIVPHWTAAPAVVESFDTARAAIRRQTELSWLFEQSGWTRLHTR